MTTAREQAREAARAAGMVHAERWQPGDGPPTADLYADAVSDVWEPLLRECKEAFDSEDGPSEDLYRRIQEALR